MTDDPLPVIPMGWPYSCHIDTRQKETSHDLPRAMLEAWADLHEVDPQVEESDEDLRARIIATHIHYLESVERQFADDPFVIQGTVTGRFTTEPEKDILDITRDFINQGI